MKLAKLLIFINDKHDDSETKSSESFDQQPQTSWLKNVYIITCNHFLSSIASFLSNCKCLTVKKKYTFLVGFDATSENDEIEMQKKIIANVIF